MNKREKDEIRALLASLAEQLSIFESCEAFLLPHVYGTPDAPVTEPHADAVHRRLWAIFSGQNVIITERILNDLPEETVRTYRELLVRHRRSLQEMAESYAEMIGEPLPEIDATPAYRARWRELYGRLVADLWCLRGCGSSRR